MSFSDKKSILFKTYPIPIIKIIDKIVISNGASGVVTIEEINYVNKLTKDLILKVLETNIHVQGVNTDQTQAKVVKEQVEESKEEQQ